MTSKVRPVWAGMALLEALKLPTPEVDYVYGASFAFPLALVREVGMLCEKYFLYYE